MNVHICLVSADLMPNIIGALYDHADMIVPVITEESEWMVGLLRKSLASTGAKINVTEPFKVVPFDLNDCSEVLLRIANTYPRACFNWTGGTKVMSYAARFAAETAKARAIYVMSNSREILFEDFLNRKQEVRITDSTELGLNILSYLYAAGNTVSDAATPEEFKERYCPANDLVIAANAIMEASQSERRDIFLLAGAENNPVKPLKLNTYFLQVLCKARLIQPARNHGQYFLNIDSLMPASFLESPQQANARFLRASFLEVFLWSQIKTRSGYDEVGWGIQLNPGQTGRFMEIDLAIAGEGRLLIVEAKTTVDLHNITDLIEEQHARCNRIAGKFGKWLLYIHKFKGEFMNEDDQSRIASAEARAKNFGGLLLWHDNLEELPARVGEILNESPSII
ncbi:MAG: hypothetical protein ACP5T0_12350 [Verrucomicrobiia bacterium]